jgi:hypothetical protein
MALLRCLPKHAKEEEDAYGRNIDAVVERNKASFKKQK